VGLSFHRANPKFGGRSSLAAPKGLTPTVTLPDCLQALLGRHVLRMDRRELLARASAQLQKDAELQVRLLAPALPPPRPCPPACLPQLPG
jgi:hypothetical protein